MRKVIGTILFIFLLILSTLGVAAYVIQHAYGDITFVEWFQMITNK